MQIKNSVQVESTTINKILLKVKNFDTTKVEEKKGKNHIIPKKYSVKPLELKFIKLNKFKKIKK